jgi:hypothetical protein
VRTDVSLVRRHSVPLLLASALAIFASPLHADPPTVRYCEIAIDFSIGGKRVASPSAIVEFGQEAEVTIGNPDEHAWRFRILADAPAVVHRVNVIPISIALDEVAEGRSYPRASPELRAVPGQRADIESIFGDGDGRRAHLAVVANPRSDAEIDALRNAAGEQESN